MTNQYTVESGRSILPRATGISDACELDEAKAIFEEQERVNRQIGNLDGLQASLGNRALILKDWGRLDEAIGSAGNG